MEMNLTFLLIMVCVSPIIVQTLSIGQSTNSSVRPIVMWHGMGDSCCNPLSLGGFKSFLEKEIETVYVKSIMIGDDIVQDTENGFFKNVNDQVQIACDQIAADPQLAQGYNAIGFSQGGQFLRAVAQRCPTPQMHNLISLGGQHQGVYGLPHCFYPTHKLCDYVRRILNIGAYWRWVQDSLVQAEYWHDPMNEEKYQKGSIFLADINNEKVTNTAYKKNLLKLDNLVLVKFEEDTMVEPSETSWFEFYTPGQGVKITPLNQSDIYVKDKLGLKKLDKTGRLHFLSSPGDHLRFTKEWFKAEIIEKFLR